MSVTDSVYTIARPAAVRGDARATTTVRELVEWTYAVQRAHRGGEASVGAAGISQTGVVMEVGRLGCMVDRSPSGAAFWGQTHCDDDALAVHGCVEDMQYRERSLLIECGAVRSMPEWSPLVLPLRVVPVPGRKGQHKGLYDRHGHAVGCEVTYEGDAPTRAVYAALRSAWPDAPVMRVAEDVIEHARAVYASWVDALVALQDMLSWQRLRRWRVVGLGAELAPWINNC